jgi:uncharacterized protein YkwD
VLNSPASADSAPAPAVPSVELQLFALTNQARQAYGLPALVTDDRLTEAAQLEADAMAQFELMDHDLPGAPYPTFQSRLQYAGYNYLWAGENIAMGQPSAAAAVADWMASAGHRANMLSPYPTAIGVAVAYDSHGVPYYCQVFGEAQ